MRRYASSERLARVLRTTRSACSDAASPSDRLSVRARSIIQMPARETNRRPVPSTNSPGRSHAYGVVDGSESSSIF